MRLRLLIAVAAAALVGAGPAQVTAAPAVEGASFGQGSVFSIGAPIGAKDVTESEAPLFVTGTLSVDFHSDPASGCAALAGCMYAGTMVYRPSGGQLLQASYRMHGRRQRVATVILGSLGSSTGDEFYARVTRQVAGAGPAVCADATPAGGFLSARRAGSRFVFDLVQALTSTRCAGPVPADLEGAAPALTLSLPTRSGTHADLRMTRSFAGHGFAGTVTSTLRVTVGTSSASASANSPTPPGLHLHRVRDVQRAVTVAAETGALTFDVRGTPDAAVCILLDSCGLTGRLTLRPGLVGVTGNIAAVGPARRSESYFARALFGQRVRGVAVSGGLIWARAGTMTSSLHQATACVDTAPAGSGSLSLASGNGRLRAGYGLAGDLFASSGSLRSRCPGPQIAARLTLASGSSPRAALSAKTATIVLRAGPAFQDDGYVVTPRGQLSLTLRFGGVSQQLFSAPGP